ncbi:MAG: hypothetical protein AAF657_04530 [Acidobacteriota bacterium]
MMHRATCRAAMAVLALTLLIAAPAAFGSEAETLILFDPTPPPETPESIVFDRHDNAYISLLTTGEIRKVAPDLTQTSLAFLPIGAPCGPAFTLIAGLAIDFFDRLFVAVTACDPSNSGIWEVDTEDGSIELVANSPSFTVWNGIDVHKGFIYAADTFDGLVWRIPKNGGTPEIWADDPLLKRPPGAMFPGPNGLQFFRGKIFIANSSTGDIVGIPLRHNGTAGQAFVEATLPAPQGCDEFAFDILGRIYCTTDPFNTIVRLNRDGSSDILLTAEDGLDGPTSVAFGRRGSNRRNLYITNAAFPIFTTTFRPSLMRLRVNLPGAPFEF